MTSQTPAGISRPSARWPSWLSGPGSHRSARQARLQAAQQEGAFADEDQYLNGQCRGPGLVAGVIYFVIAFATGASAIASIIGGIVVAAIAIAIGLIFRAVYKRRAAGHIE